MTLFNSVLQARQKLSKARYEMAFSDKDIFIVEGNLDDGYHIAMYSANNVTFCGYY